MTRTSEWTWEWERGWREWSISIFLKRKSSINPHCIAYEPIIMCFSPPFIVACAVHLICVTFAQHPLNCTLYCKSIAGCWLLCVPYGIRWNTKRHTALESHLAYYHSQILYVCAINNQQKLFSKQPKQI